MTCTAKQELTSCPKIRRSFLPQQQARVPHHTRAHCDLIPPPPRGSLAPLRHRLRRTACQLLALLAEVEQGRFAKRVGQQLPPLLGLLAQHADRVDEGVQEQQLQEGVLGADWQEVYYALLLVERTMASCPGQVGGWDAVRL